MGEFVINGTGFEWSCKFSGAGGNDIGKTLVRAMSLNETLFQPFYDGTITFMDPANMVDSLIQTRGDGSEKLTINFAPKGASASDSVMFDFVLDGELNSPAVNSRMNSLKTYRLLDANYFKLNEPIPYGKRYRGLVGDILKEIFTDKGLPVGGFAPGDHEVDIFPEHILPPTCFRYSDLVKYLMRINYNKVGGSDGAHVRSLLYWNRKNGEYVLTPMSKIFSGGDAIEGFVCGEFGDGGGGSGNENNPSEGAPHYPVSFLHSSDLTTPLLSYSNKYFMNYLATGYDPQLGEHGIREIRIKDVKKKWGSAIGAVGGEVLGGAGKAFLPLNSSKTDTLFKTFSLPFSLDKVAKLAEAEMIGNMTFLNMELALYQLGHPARSAGEFVNVLSLAPTNDGDAKLCGKWLITKCSHQFASDSYYNTINCVKTNVGTSAGANLTQDC